MEGERAQHGTGATGGGSRAARRRLLEAHEQVIEQGLPAFREVGRALGEIEEGGLYRDLGFGSFDEYLEARWLAADTDAPAARPRRRSRASRSSAT
jgi:hypothetical protein